MEVPRREPGNQTTLAGGRLRLVSYGTASHIVSRAPPLAGGRLRLVSYGTLNGPTIKIAAS